MIVLVSGRSGIIIIVIVLSTSAKIIQLNEWGCRDFSHGASHPYIPI